MSETFPPCPHCAEDYTYEAGLLLVCPMCGHEWDPAQTTPSPADNTAEMVIKDAVGNVLEDGDDVTIAKSLKVKGGGGAIKIGTKVRGIRLLTDGVVDGHDIDAKVPGFGPMKLKSSVVKKVV